MILFDTSVIMDARDKSSPWHVWAREQIALAVANQEAVINPIVLAESAARSPTPDKVQAELESYGLDVLPLPVTSANPAAIAHAAYLARLKKEGRTGPKVPLPDFFIGAHAQAEGFTLCTRDPQRIRSYFPVVKLITPQSET